MTTDAASLGLTSPIGLVAGNGVFPIQFAERARELGLEVIVVAHKGETDPSIERFASKCVWIKVGQLGKLIKTFTKSGVKQATFAGGIKRINIFKGVRLDLKAVALIARLGSVKDDIILRGIASELERIGIAVIGAHILLDKAVPSAGVLTRRDLTQDELKNVIIGWEAATLIGRLDIGQTVVVNGGVVTAVEAVEGTDEAIRRAGHLSGRGSVVVKLAKPQQDLRLDLPAVGPETIETMKRAGSSALVIQSGRAIFLDPQEIITRANGAGIAIVAFDDQPLLTR